MAADEDQLREKWELDRSHNDPENWWGPFYYNKRDPRIFPPKRIAAMGWTTNFANPKSVAVLILVIVLSLAIFGGLPYLFQKH